MFSQEVQRPDSKVCSEHIIDWQYLSRGDLAQNEFSQKVNLQATSSPGSFSLALEVGHTSKAREKRPGDEVDLQVFLCINVSL